MKTRLIGAGVLIAIAVIVVPMLFPGAPPKEGKEQSLDLNIPPPPDSQMQSRTLSVAPAGSTAGNGQSGDTGGVQVQPGQSGHLATVNIPSRRPQDVHPENSPAPQAGAGDNAPAQAQEATQGASDDAASAPAPSEQAPRSAPQPAPPKPAPKPPEPKAKPASTPPKPTQPAPSSAPGTAAQGHYTISLGAYADKSNAQKLLRRVRALGYPVNVSEVHIGGKPAAKVEAGPFGTRAEAEKARLKLKSSIPSAPVALQEDAANQGHDAPAHALGKKAGGWAVQLAAYSTRADAIKLRDSLRAQGFDGFVDDVKSGGRTLWRVRAGPETSRADAVQLRSRIQAKLHKNGVVVTVP
ncbi:SPOR domain-containing protein [Oleiagrimonas sp. C23AA]|nr:SPOR domain-containing protein [Oleiagrimonas sp. C23AA]